MPALRLEREGEIAILRLDGPHGNAIGKRFVEELLVVLDRLEADPTVRGVLLASAHPRIFCPGLDLRELFPLERPALESFLALFSDGLRRLFFLQKPVVAALAGHAVAGGCVIALCADFRVLDAEGSLLGLNEIRLGVPLPWGVAVIVRHSVLPSMIAEAVMLGRNFSGPDAVAAGLAHQLAPSGEVERVARERLLEFVSRDAAALASLKRSLRADAERSMREGDPAHAGEFLDVWFSPPTRRKVEEAVRALEERGRSR